MSHTPRQQSEFAVAQTDTIQRSYNWLRTHVDGQEPPTFGARERRGLYAVLVLVAAYTAVLSAYCIGLQNTFRTHAEELGIMDQVLWNTVHGHFMQESICNAVWGGNCLGSVSRFAIHFEPILILLSPIYLVVANVKILLVLQAAGVAVGAVPAFLLATWRLRHPAWGLLFAVLYLAYPPLISGVIHDFHPEVAAAGLLLWALYFLIARRTRALLITCVVLLMCKETLTLDVMMMGVFAALLQRRVRLGLGLFAMGAATLVLALALMRLTSPLGHSPVTDRFSPLLQQPVQAVIADVTDPQRLAYLIKILGPVGFLPLLSPWTSFMAGPSISLNFFSTFSSMYSGSNQYNSDIGPVLVFSAIDALVWLAPAAGKVLGQVRLARAPVWRSAGLDRWLRPQVLVVALVVIGGTLEGPSLAQHVGGHLSDWPTATAHTRLGEHVLTLIPADASVSAQSTLVPHVSERTVIHEFPSGQHRDQYIFLDTTADTYPFFQPADYEKAVKSLLDTPAWRVEFDEDGYLLLHRT